MKKNNKFIYIILFTLLFANIFVYLYITFYTSKSTYLILDYNNIIEINNDRYKLKNNIAKRLDNSQAFLIEKEIMEGYLKIENGEEYFDNHISFYDKNLNIISDTYKSILVTDARKMKNYSYLLSYDLDDVDKKNIQKYLIENSLGTYSKNIDTIKANLPNGDIIYSIKYISSSSLDDESYSVVFMKQEDNFTTIYSKTGIDFSSKISEISKIVDINNDGYIDLIMSSSRYASDDNICYSLHIYNNKNNSYENVIKCEEE